MIKFDQIYHKGELNKFYKQWESDVVPRESLYLLRATRLVKWIIYHEALQELTILC